MLEVKVLPKDMCLAIANAVGHTGDDEEKLLYLPDSVFGNTFDVDCCTGNFYCYGSAEDRKLHWEIPAYFCQTVSIKVHHKE